MAEIIIPLVAVGISALTTFALSSPKLVQDQTRNAGDVNLRVPRSDYASPIPKVYGRVRLEGNKFFPDTIEKMYEVVVETSTEEVSQPGKGGGGGSTSTITTETKKVYGTWAVLFCQHGVTLEKLIVNGKQMTPSSGFFQEYCEFFDGTQIVPWSRISALSGNPTGDIAYTGIAYIGFDRVPLADYGNILPQQVSVVVVDSQFGEFPTMDLVVQDICERAGLPPSDIDVTELSGITLRHGFTVTNSSQSYRQVLNELMQLYLFSAVETNDGKIKFKTFDRGTETPLVLNPEDFLPISESGLENKLFVKTTTPKQDLPNKITYKFFNINQQYNQDEIVEYFEEFTKENNIGISSNITSNAYHIKEQIRKLLRYLFLTKRNSYKFKLPATFINQIDLLDLISLPNGEVVQVYQINTGNDYTLDITANYYEGLTEYTYNPSDLENSGQGNDLPDPITIPNVYILDIPQIADYPPATLYVLATDAAVLQISLDNQQSYFTSVNHLKPSTIGDALTPLPNVTGLDVVNTIDVRLESGALETITQNQFDLGYNLALLGNVTPNGVYVGKMIKFRDVTALGGDDYRLSYLFQGELNTQNYDTSSLPLKFFLLTAPTTAYYSVLMGSANQIGQTITIVPVISNWQDIGATTPITIVPEGNAYVPLAVTNITSEIDSDPPPGNITLQWTDPNGNNSPYQNGTEIISYEIDIYDPTVVRTISVSSPTAFYSLSDQVADGVTLPFDVRIYRVSSIVGRGAEALATISSPTFNPNLSGLIDADLLDGELPDFYLDRTNHTGTQLVSTISDIATVGVTNSYNDLDNRPELRMIPKDVVANYTLQQSDYKCWIRANGNITITLPNGLDDYFECAIQNVGTGTITISATGTLESVGTTIPIQWRAAHVYYHSINTWTATGFLV